MQKELSVGDKTQDDSLVVLDEDRLCYSVKSVSNGAVGVRTISKALLAEWVEAYRESPDMPSQTAREKLVGKTEIDRFEYGYAGTLAKMAKMVLGQIPVVHADVGDKATREEIMKKQWKRVDAQAAQKHGARSLADAFGGDGMLQRLAAALRTKPFAILAGHSGTGKSRLVRRLAYMTCNDEALAAEGEGRTAPGNYCMVQVKPNWHDSSDLLGYFSEMGGRHFVNTPFVSFLCKAHAHPGTPFFVCLDEMNLAPVEQYFAEYLSAIESMEEKNGVWLTDPLVETERSGEEADPEFLGQVMKGAESVEAAEWIAAHGLTIPKNLFVVGTVNMDETTCQFSRKVLDRAMTLLMTEADFGGMANVRKPSEEELLDDDGIRFFLDGGVRGAVGGIESALLDGINEPLANTAFVVAYRFANEYALYEAALAKLEGFDTAAAGDAAKKAFAAKALDHVVLMKLLPRIHGERRIVDVLFNGHKVKGEGGEKNLPGLKDKVPAEGMSAKMMEAILARPDEYLTFWP